MNFSFSLGRFSFKCCQNAGQCTQKIDVFPLRQYSVTRVLCHLKRAKKKFLPKYPTKLQAGRGDRYNRSDIHRLLNMSVSKIPFDSNFPVTAKHTGPQVEGGSIEAQRLTALHMVQQPGYTKKSGKFIKVKEMEPEFVVPDLSDTKLKPYVPYKVTDVYQTKVTSFNLFEAFYGEKMRDKVDLEAVPEKKQSKGFLSSVNIFKKDK